MTAHRMTTDTAETIYLDRSQSAAWGQHVQASALARPCTITATPHGPLHITAPLWGVYGLSMGERILWDAFAAMAEGRTIPLAITRLDATNAALLLAAIHAELDRLAQ